MLYLSERGRSDVGGTGSCWYVYYLHWTWKPWCPDAEMQASTYSCFLLERECLCKTIWFRTNDDDCVDFVLALGRLRQEHFFNMEISFRSAWTTVFRVLKPFLRKNKNRKANKSPRNWDFVVWCVLGPFVFKVQSKDQSHCWFLKSDLQSCSRFIKRGLEKWLSG